jgi:hypothetical protein
MFAQIPQLVKNWSRQSSESLSPAFLTCWLLGDLTNLLGCLLTQQQAFQVRMAAYFVSMDVVMLTQFAYFQWKTMKNRDKEDETIFEEEKRSGVYPRADVSEDQINNETAPLLPSKRSLR